MRRLVLFLVVAALPLAALTRPAGASLSVTWMRGYAAPGTPARYDKVGVIKVGPASARNVLVLEPGTSSGSAYFVPLARWIVARAKGWQVWSVERRENLLEDQSELNLAKQHKATGKQLVDYYLGYLADPAVTRHFQAIPDSTVAFARRWGLRVAVEDLHRVIASAHRLGGRVVLGGHSLGGSVVTAYATWSFGGRPGANDLSGLVYDDGGSFGSVTAQKAARSLRLLAKAPSPWLTFSGIPAPYLGIFSSLGSTAALAAPNGPSVGQASPLLPALVKPPVPVTNLALFGFNTDPATSKLAFAIQAHVGRLDTSVSPAGWSRAGALTPVDRYAQMLSGTGLTNVDGSEWYFPARLSIDTSAVDEGNANPAQQVLGLRATEGHRLPRQLRIYAFGAYGGTRVTAAALTLAKESHIPRGNLTLISRRGTYAHNDPASAYPHNLFFDKLVPFLAAIAH